MNREDAEDIVEETFITAFSAFGMYDPARASFATWITRIAHNKAVNKRYQRLLAKCRDMLE